MEILQLKYFCDAAETQNFSKTAQKFMVPPSCISASVKRLEKELGVKLFNRSANKASLNDAGRKFYNDVRRALNLLDKAEKEVKQNEALKEIKLLASCNRRIVTECIEKFRQSHKDVSFLITHKTEQLLSDFDMIVSDVPMKDAANEILLITEPFLLAVSKNHPLASKNEILPSDLKDEKFITMQKGSSHHNITQTLCEKHGFTPETAIEIDDPHYIRKYTEMGLGISFVPTVSWHGLFSQNVLLKKVKDMDCERKTYLIFPRKPTQKHHMEFADALLEKVKEQLS